MKTTAMDTTLGSREIDAIFPYDNALDLYKREVSYYQSWLLNAKKSAYRKPFPFLSHLKPLTTCQQKCLDIFKEQVRLVIQGVYTVYTLNGYAGSGKTSVLYHMGALLQNTDVKFAFISPTAQGCLPYDSQTLHSFCGIFNVKQSAKQMIHDPVHPKVKQRLKNVQIILIDEVYLAGGRLISMLLKRIAYVKKTDSPLPVSLVLVGDVHQLPCVLDMPINANIREEMDPMVLHACTLYHSARFRFTLKTNLRQCSDLIFAEILSRLAAGETTKEDINILSSRLSDKLSKEERHKFFSSPHLFSTNKAVDLWNGIYLSKLNIPLIKLEPQLIPDCKECLKEFPTCYVGTNVKLCLQKNLIPENCLVNGTNCVVKNVYCSKARNSFPDFITCEVTNYKGSGLSEDGTIPFGAEKEVILCRHLGQKIKVKYYPFKNNYAYTIHRSQSQTLDSAVVCLEGISPYSSAIYTAISRVRSLKDLMITTTKPLSSYFPNV